MRDTVRGQDGRTLSACSLRMHACDPRMMMTMMVSDTTCMGRVYILVRVTDADLGGGGIREQVHEFGPVVLEGHWPLCPEESVRFPDVLGYLGDVVAVLPIVCATVHQQSAEPGEGTRECEVD